MMATSQFVKYCNNVIYVLALFIHNDMYRYVFLFFTHSLYIFTFIINTMFFDYFVSTPLNRVTWNHGAILSLLLALVKIIHEIIS